MRFAGALVCVENGTVGNLMHIRDQKSVRVQVGIDRYVGTAVGHGPKITEPRSSGPDYPQDERKLLLKLLAISNGRRWYVLRKKAEHRELKTEKALRK
jgi:hypothetical protein